MPDGPEPTSKDPFPAQYSRTRRFSLGRPRTFSIAPDGQQILFLRSRAGDDPLTCLWSLHVGTGEERLVVDPSSIADSEELPPEERARRERAREQASGITSYATDREHRMAVFPLAGSLYRVDVATGEVTSIPSAPGAFDPRPDPSGSRVAYEAGGALRVVDLATGEDRVLAGEEDPDVMWGVAEFAAAEEMGRLRGYWWSPEGDAVVAARVDNGPVRRWHIADSSEPASTPRSVPFPAAGTDNADVTLHRLALDGTRTEIRWDRDAYEYLVRVLWSKERPITFLVQSRSQRDWVVLTAGDDGATREVWRDHDGVWLDIWPGMPAWTPSGALVMLGNRGDARRILVDGEPVTPEGLQVRRIADVADDILFEASEVDVPEEVHVFIATSGGKVTRLTTEPGVHAASRRGSTIVMQRVSMDHAGVEVTVHREGKQVAAITSLAEEPLLEPRVTFMRSNQREIRTAVILPRDAEPGDTHPVLMNPYGGPHHQMVMRSRNAFVEPQWWADQGFAVVIADGRGTPGRGVAWEHAVHLDFAGPVLDDQVEALRSAAEHHPELDLTRVAIRGWSFGGFLSALAVLRRPDVFHAAIAGAPVTDQRLYDTHYTERYLGHPDEHPEAYQRSSLIEDVPNLERPLLLIHGLADDNVYVAHTLRLSRALLEAGRPHRVLPITGATHMTPGQEGNLMRIQLAFLREALGLEP